MKSSRDSSIAPMKLAPGLRAFVHRALLAWYGKHARDLPWRRTHDPYAIWISEIMLQQTQVDTVQPYYQRFLHRFPTVAVLAAAHEDQVLKKWEGLGYYSRARNLHQAARQIVRQRKGKWPATALEWRTLPGIGAYTANAIASIAQQEPVPVLDGNVKRVLSRFIGLTLNIDTVAGTRTLWQASEALVHSRAPGDFNQALMELGARICSPKNPDCPTCPVKTRCQALASNRVQHLPVRTRKQRVPHHNVVIALMSKNGQYLVGKRPRPGLLAGLWEFPGGKVKSNETLEQALRREIREELGIGIKNIRKLTSVEHAYTHFTVSLHAFHCAIRSGTPRARYHEELRWVLPRDFRHKAFPKANLKIISELIRAAPKA